MRPARNRGIIPAITPSEPPTPADATIKQIARDQLNVQKQIEVNTGATTVAASPSMPATTTQQEDITTAGQRRINLIWEYSQAIIALLVVIANMIVGTYHGIWKHGDADYPFILSSSLFLVIGFYFSRTNHAAIGGIGNKPTGAYVGR